MKSRISYLALVLMLAVASILPAHADSYKGTMTRLGTKMEYSLSGATITDKNEITVSDCFQINIRGKVEVGSTISATFKKLIDYKRKPGNVTVGITAKTTEGKTITLQKEKEGKESATASVKVPDNVETVEIFMFFLGRSGGFNCNALYNVVKEGSSEEKGTPSSKGKSFSRQGTQGLMKYSISGGEEHPLLDHIIRPGDKITLSCSVDVENILQKTIKTFCILRNNGDVVKEVWGVNSASLSYTIPANMRGIMQADIDYEDYGDHRIPCYWQISNKSGATGTDTKQEKKSTTPKEIKWDDVADDNNCIHCNREFSNYYFEFFEPKDAVTMCYHDSKETKNPIIDHPANYLYYRDYIITNNQMVVLDHCNEACVLTLYKNTTALLMGRNDDGSDRWMLCKGRVTDEHRARSNSMNIYSKQTFEMSQCFVVPTGTTYMLVEDGKTSRAFLLEGSMEVTSKKSSKKQTLTPGQVATVSSDGKIKTQKFDVEALAKKYDITLSGKNVPKNGGNNDKKQQDNTNPKRNKGKDDVKKDDTGGKVKKCKIKGVEFSMIKVEGGTFTMGATKEQSSNHSNQQPTHKVTLSTYYIGETEVTQELWEAVMGTNPSKFKGAKLPVENVSWTECQQFISKINQLTGRKFRLPTEAEWEFAARGGKSSKGYKFAGSNNADAVAWHQGNSGNKTHNVGTKSANELGLYDMCGNVWEWCQDWFGSYSSSAQTNPKGPSSGTDHLNRGGGWCHESKFATVFYRGTLGKPDRKVDNLGFRLVLEP